VSAQAEQDLSPERRSRTARAVDVLSRRWLVVAGLVLAGALAALLVHHSSAASYSASASVALQSEALEKVGLGVAPASGGERQRETNTESLVVRSPEVSRAVAEALHSSATPSTLAAEVRSEPVPSANVLRITATTREPRASANLANAFAQQYIAVRARSQLAGIESIQKRLVAQEVLLPASSPERAALRQSRQRLTTARAFAGDGARVVSLAAVPASPNGLGLPASLAIGAAGGLAVALVLIFLLDALDRRVKTLEELEREYRLPALAAIPQFAFASTSAAERRELLEPQRILRTAIDFAAVTRELDTILVTSAAVGEGKTTVAVDLAHAVALAGRSVVLVELDLRHPTFPAQFDVNVRDGLTLALTRDSEVEDLLVVPFPELPNLSVLFSGPLPPNPSELIASPKIAELIGGLAWERDLVVIDSPPLNPVADAQILLDNPAIHAVLVVARAGRATRDEVRRARAMLDRHIAEPLGLVVTGLRDVSRYGYESHYAARPSSATHQGAGAGPDASREPANSPSAPGAAPRPVGQL
jgi:capsular exopolysaccharide synthesis family protein